MGFVFFSTTGNLGKAAFREGDESELCLPLGLAKGLQVEIYFGVLIVRRVDAKVEI
jgi:hypothetical protein